VREFVKKIEGEIAMDDYPIWKEREELKKELGLE